MVCSPRLGGESAQAPAHREPRAPSTDRDRLWPRRGARRRAGRLRRRRRDARTPTSPRATSRSRSSTAKFPTASASPRPPTWLGVENTGDEHDPGSRGDDLHRRRERRRDGSFSIRSEQPGLANPNRPVWILENRYPKLVEPGEPDAELDAAAAAAPRRADQHLRASAPLRAGRRAAIGLARDAGAGRHLHGQLRDRRRPRRQGQGGHRRRRARSRASSWSRSPTSRRRPRVDDAGNVVTEESQRQRSASVPDGCGRGGRIGTGGSRRRRSASSRRLRRRRRAPTTAATADDDHDRDRDRRRRSRRAATVGDGDGGVELSEIGELRAARLRHPAARRATSDLYVVEQSGRDPAVARGRRRPEPFLDISERGHQRRRAGPALDRLRARLRALGPALRRLHRHRGRHADRRVPALGEDPRRADPDSARELLAHRPAATRTTTAACSCSGPTAALHRLWATAAAAGDPERNGQDPLDRCRSAKLAPRLDTVGDDPGEHRDLRLRPAQPVALLVRPRDRRRCRSATSARTRSRRSTPSRAARPRTPTSAGRRSRATRPLQRRPGGARTRSPPVLDVRPTTAAARSPAATSSATRARDASTAATSTATSAPGELRSFTAEPGQAGDRRPRARPRGPAAELVRRGRAGHVYAISLDGPGLPARRRIAR